MTNEIYSYDKEGFRQAHRLLLQLKRRVNDLERSRVKSSRMGSTNVTQHRPAILTTTLDAGETGTAQFYIGEPGEEETLETRTVADWGGFGGVSGDRGHVFRAPYKAGVAWYFAHAPKPTAKAFIHWPGAPQTITTGSYQTITLFSGTGGEEGGSIAGMADRANNKIVVPFTDWFDVTMFAYLTASGGSTISIRATAGGSAISQATVTAINLASAPVPFSITVPASLTAGQDIQMQAVSGGGNISLTNPKLAISN